MSNQIVPLPLSEAEEQKLAIKNEQKQFGSLLEAAFDGYCESEELETVAQQAARINTEDGLQFVVSAQGFEPEKARRSAAWGENLLNYSDQLGKYVTLDYELRDADDNHADPYYLFTLACQ